MPSHASFYYRILFYPILLVMHYYLCKSSFMNTSLVTCCILFFSFTFWDIEHIASLSVLFQLHYLASSVTLLFTLPIHPADFFLSRYLCFGFFVYYLCLYKNVNQSFLLQRLQKLRNLSSTFSFLQIARQCGRSRGWIVRSKLKGAIASIVLVSYSK